MASHLLALFTIVIASTSPGVWAIVEECSACKCVSKELHDRLASEKHKDPLDLRNRLDSQGNRYGKVIEFRLSEQRVHDLLEGMCEAVAKKSTLYTTSWTGGPGSRMWSSSSATRDPSVPENGTWAEPPRAEKDGRQKELENYCIGLLDEHEDALIDVLKGEAGDLDNILCVQYTKACTAAALEAAEEAADRSEL